MTNILRIASRVSSFRFIDSKNFGLSGSHVITRNVIKCMLLATIKCKRHGVKCHPNTSKSNLSGMMAHASSGPTMKRAGRKIATIDTARFLVRLLWNSVAYENELPAMPDILYTKKILYIFSKLFILCSQTHTAPTSNRISVNQSTDVQNADPNAKIKPDSSDACNTFLRPHVSAKKPHKCDVETMPRKPTEFKSPCSVTVTSMSHCIYGNKKLGFTFSKPMPSNAQPAAKMIIILNLPCSAGAEEEHLVSSQTVSILVLTCLLHCVIVAVSFARITWKNTNQYTP